MIKIYKEIIPSDGIGVGFETDEYRTGFTVLSKKDLHLELRDKLEYLISIEEIEENELVRYFNKWSDTVRNTIKYLNKELNNEFR